MLKSAQKRLAAKKVMTVVARSPRLYVVTWGEGIGGQAGAGWVVEGGLMGDLKMGLGPPAD